MTKKLRDRTKVVASLIHLAYQLKELNNFNGFMAIYTGLTRGIPSALPFLIGLLAPIQRMKQTFSEVEKLKDGTPKMWHEIQALGSPDQNYSVIRNALRNSPPPCIPYLGTYLEELATVEVITFLEFTHSNRKPTQTTSVRKG